MNRVSLIAALLVVFCIWRTSAITGRKVDLSKLENPCCAFPCAHQSECFSTPGQGAGYFCDCAGTQYSGINCDIPSWRQWFKNLITPSHDTVNHILHHYDFIWSIINNVYPIRKAVMSFVIKDRDSRMSTPPRYVSDFDYKAFDVSNNNSYYARFLPPVHKDCPTPAGIFGKPERPDLDFLINNFFLRKKFIPNPKKSSILFGFFAQHFTHQFFKTNFSRGPAFLWDSASHGVDMSQIYGEDRHDQLELRTLKDGKMKMQIVDGEEYPPFLKDAHVRHRYPAQVPEERRYALGNDVNSLLPGLFVYQTIWLREHNRLVIELKKDHPNWDDERLWQTARLINIALCIKIVIEEYVQHLSGYNFALLWDPETVHGTSFQYQNRMNLEFNHMYHWHPLIPDFIEVNGHNYSIRDLYFRGDLVMKDGLNNWVEALSTQRAGRVYASNTGKDVIEVPRTTILHGRYVRLQPYNQYRVFNGLDVYTSFEQLTGEKEMAKLLEEAYGEIDAVEYYVGLYVEKLREGGMFGELVSDIGAAPSLHGLLGNIINTPGWWSPHTFGGERFFQLIKTTILKDFFCRNLKYTDRCPTVEFKVPEEFLAKYHDEL